MLFNVTSRRVSVVALLLGLLLFTHADTSLPVAVATAGRPANVTVSINAPSDLADPTAYSLATLQGTPLPPRYQDGPAATFSGTVNVLTGYLELGAVDMEAPARGMALVNARQYSSYDAVAGNTGPFSPGWSWSYGTRAIVNPDQSVTIAESSGRRARTSAGPAAASATG